MNNISTFGHCVLAVLAVSISCLTIGCIPGPPTNTPTPTPVFTPTPTPTAPSVSDVLIERPGDLIQDDHLNLSPEFFNAAEIVTSENGDKMICIREGGDPAAFDQTVTPPTQCDQESQHLLQPRIEILCSENGLMLLDISIAYLWDTGSAVEEVAVSASYTVDCQISTPTPTPASTPTPMPVTFNLDPAPGTHSGPVELTVTADAAEIFYKVFGRVDSRVCSEPYDGNTIEVKDTTHLSFFGTGDDSQYTTDNALDYQKYTITNPVYPNSVLREAWLKAEEELSNLLMCKIGKPSGRNDGVCVPNVDADGDGNNSIDEIGEFVYDYHRWSMVCPEGGFMAFEWENTGFNEVINWPFVEVVVTYHQCTINGYTIQGTLEENGVGTRLALRQNPVRLYFDGGSQVEITGPYNGQVRETTERLYNAIELVEIARAGNYYVKCSDLGCSSDEGEVRYRYSENGSYYMLDPEAIAADSCP